MTGMDLDSTGTHKVGRHQWNSTTKWLCEKCINVCLFRRYCLGCWPQHSLFYFPLCPLALRAATKVLICTCTVPHQVFFTIPFLPSVQCRAVGIISGYFLSFPSPPHRLLMMMVSTLFSRQGENSLFETVSSQKTLCVPHRLFVWKTESLRSLAAILRGFRAKSFFYCKPWLRSSDSSSSSSSN